MVLVYMLTKMGYIDGIHVTIYTIYGSYGFYHDDIHHYYTQMSFFVVLLLLIVFAIVVLHEHKIVMYSYVCMVIYIYCFICVFTHETGHSHWSYYIPKVEITRLQLGFSCRHDGLYKHKHEPVAASSTCY